MAPEVMKDQPYTEKADVYSFALVLYEMVFIFSDEWLLICV